LARLQQSPLAESFKKRDTDGDGVVDVKELAKGTDVYENTRISAAGGKDTIEARKQALQDHIHNPVRAHPKKGEGTDADLRRRSGRGLRRQEQRLRLLHAEDRSARPEDRHYPRQARRGELPRRSSL
jgi:hypothetical protein